MNFNNDDYLERNIHHQSKSYDIKYLLSVSTIFKLLDFRSDSAILVHIVNINNSDD